MNSAIYFGIPSSGKDIVSARVKSLGLNLIRGTPSRMQILGISHTLQPYYESYRLNIPSFMKAYLTGRKVQLSDVGCHTTVSISLLFPLATPDILFTLPKYKQGNPPAAISDRLSEMGAGKYVYDRVTYFKLQTSVPGRMKEIMELGPSSDNKLFVHTGVTNLDGVKAIQTVRQIFSVFFRLNQYPAYWTEEKEQDVGQWYTFEVTGMKRRRPDADESEEGTSRGQRRSISRDVAMEEDDSRPNTQAIDPSTIREAKPPTTRNLHPWGDSANMPNADGLFFAYVPELSADDFSTVIEVIRSIFARFLGNTVNQIHSEFARLNRAWPRVATTPAAHILSHMATGIYLSLETQTVCYPIFQANEYVGYSLLGARFSVSVQGRIFTPLAHDDLVKVVENADSHISTVRLILAIISRHMSSAQRMLLPSAEELKSLREIHQLVKSCDTFSDEDREEILGLAQKTSFRSKSLGVSKDTILMCLEAFANFGLPEYSSVIGTSVSGLRCDIPMAHGALFSNDPWTLILSAFGNFAPSPIVPNGTVMRLANSTAMKDEGEDSLLCFFDRPLAEAARDWAGFVENGEIANNPKGRAVSSKFRTYKKKDRAEMVAKMISIVSEKKEGGQRPVFAGVVEGGIGDFLEFE